MNYIITFVLMCAALFIGAAIGVYSCALGFYQQIADGVLIQAEDDAPAADTQEMLTEAEWEVIDDICSDYRA